MIWRFVIAWLVVGALLEVGFAYGRGWTGRNSFVDPGGPDAADHLVAWLWPLALLLAVAVGVGNLWPEDLGKRARQRHEARKDPNVN